jgi:tetrahydromethanopterin S-methyltransferase subunit G
MVVSDLERFSRIVLDEFKLMHERFDALDGRFDHMEGRFESVEQRLTNIEHEVTAIHQRLDELEELVASHAGFTKEIDHLLKRIAAIEKHLGLQHSIKA